MPSASANTRAQSTNRRVPRAFNKVDGVRAVNAHDAEEAAISRRHNDTNVLTLGERTTSPEQALEIVKSFLSTDFEGGRHQRRVEKIAKVEGHNHPSDSTSQA